MERLFLENPIGKYHHLGNGRVKIQSRGVLAYLLDSYVKEPEQLLGGFIVSDRLLRDPPDSL